MFAIADAPEISQDALPVCLRAENPYRLVSLLEIMLAVKPDVIIRLSRSLWICSSLTHVKDPSYREAAISQLENALGECLDMCSVSRLDLPVSTLHIKDALDVLRLRSEKTDGNAIERLAGQVSDNIAKELSLREYFTLPSDKAKLYSAKNWFGDQVADAFPSTGYDANEALKCYALSRNTACVFHLMRVLEIGLISLAKHLSVPHAHSDWGNMINGIEGKINAIDKDPNKPANWKDEREYLCQCISDFRTFKNAWRNYTAHARGKYDDEDAVEIMGSVKSFMRQISTRFTE
jgi:hypothetical protein